MPVQIGQKPQADFNDPLGMLSDCHRRIEGFLAALVTLARENRGKPLNDGDRQSLRGALEYFRHSGPRHTADEEESLFPRMRASEEAAGALRAIETLHEDHVVADGAHAEIDALGSQWLEQGALTESEASRLRDVLEMLAQLYARHIDVEDHQVFPAAGRALRREDIASIGDEMARRRGLR